MAAAEWGRKMKKPYLGRPFPLEQYIIIICTVRQHNILKYKIFSTTVEIDLLNQVQMLYFTLDESNSTASEAVQNGLLNVYWIGLAILQAWLSQE